MFASLVAATMLFQAAPQPAPPATPVAQPPASASLKLKPADDWGDARSMDENDAARFAPSKPAPGAQTCRSDSGTMVCGGDSKSQGAAKTVLKDLTSPK